MSHTTNEWYVITFKIELISERLQYGYVHEALGGHGDDGQLHQNRLLLAPRVEAIPEGTLHATSER